MMIAFYFLFGSLASVTAQFVQPQHASLTQQASLTCYRRNNQYVVFFTLLARSDTISIVYLTTPGAVALTTIGTLDSRSNGIVGDGSDANPYELEVVLNGPLNALTLVNGNIPAIIIPDGVVIINIMSKENTDIPQFHRFIYARDIIWVARCDFTMEQTVTAFLLASGSPSEDAIRRAETGQLQIFRQAFDAPTLIASVGEPLYLVLSVNPPTTATGIYGFNCFVCDLPTCTGSMAQRFLDDNGCPLFNGFINQFQRIGGQFRTNVFLAFQGPGAELYFVCSVDYCYTPNQGECLDFCAANTGTGRRRRAASSNTTSVQSFTTILRVAPYNSTIGSSPKDLQSDTEVTSGDTEILMATVISVSVGLVIVLLIVVIIFVHKYAGRKSANHVTGTQQ